MTGDGATSSSSGRSWLVSPPSFRLCTSQLSTTLYSSTQGSAGNGALCSWLPYCSS